MKRAVQTFFFLLYGLHLINSAFRKEVLFPLDGSGVKSLIPSAHVGIKIGPGAATVLIFGQFIQLA